MLRLLQEVPQSEYPGDYLVARLRARRAFKQVAESAPGRDEPRPGEDAGKIRHKVLAERRWLFCQLNGQLRRDMAPLFLYFEIKTLVRCLRFLESGRHDEVDGVLSGSLLAGEMKKILNQGTGLADAVIRIERLLKKMSWPAAGLAEACRGGGVKKCEVMLHGLFFDCLGHSRLHPDMRDFFRHLTDTRNAVAVAKCLRWNVPLPPVFQNGGSYKPELIGTDMSRDRLERMTRRLTRGKVLSETQADPVQLEPVLQAGLLQGLTRKRWDGGSLMTCIEYVWINYLKAGNRFASLDGLPGGDNPSQTREEYR